MDFILAHGFRGFNPWLAGSIGCLLGKTDYLGGGSVMDQTSSSPAGWKAEWASFFFSFYPIWAPRLLVSAIHI
jgi:hypothetical protein